MVYDEQLLSFWESGILGHVRPTVPTLPKAGKNLGHWVSNKLPWETALHMVLCCHWFLKRNKYVAHNLSGRDALPDFVPCVVLCCFGLISFYYYESWLRLLSQPYWVLDIRLANYQPWSRLGHPHTSCLDCESPNWAASLWEHSLYYAWSLDLCAEHCLHSVWALVPYAMLPYLRISF